MSESEKMSEYELTDSIIRSLRSSFEDDPKNRLAQNAAGKNGLLETLVSREKLNGRVHVYNTAVPDEGKPVTHQRSSGRCWIFALLNTMRLV